MRPRPRCGWLWLHEHPSYLVDTGREHGCTRPPDHPGIHMCYCGDKCGRQSR